VRDAVLHELRSVDREAIAGIPVAEPRLRVQPDLAVADLAHCLIHQGAGETAATGGRRDHDAPDPDVRPVVQHPQGADQLVPLLGQDVTGAGLEVAAVEIGVRRLLLDDEDLLPQPPQGIRRAAVELVEAEHPDRHARNPTIWRIARLASGMKGRIP
jgi:hypothetical protein